MVPKRGVRVVAVERCGDAPCGTTHLADLDILGAEVVAIPRTLKAASPIRAAAHA